MELLELIKRETNRTFDRRGKEYHGTCPFCNFSGNTFVIFHAGGRYWCRECGKKGDSIQFVRDYKHLSFNEAKESLGLINIIDTNDSVDTSDTNDTNDTSHKKSLSSPCEQWQGRAFAFLSQCQSALWQPTGERALDWLHRRGLTDNTIRRAGLGYCPVDSYADRVVWGLPEERDLKGRVKGLWLPRGVLIPWLVDGALWGLRTRRPAGDPKYYWLPGGTPNALYNADSISPGCPVALLEGEIDALSISQEVPEVAAVATGSTHAARRVRWLARLATAETVLIAYDSDEAGDNASEYWMNALPIARRWRPFWSDANQMQQDGVDLRGWLCAGLGVNRLQPTQPTIDVTEFVGQTVDAQTYEAVQRRVQALGWKIDTQQRVDGWKIERITARSEGWHEQDNQSAL